MDLKLFLEQFHDHLAPRLDVYEQAIYLYIFRKSRLVGNDEVVIGFQSARLEIALGVGERGKPMSPDSCYRKVASLEAKRCIKKIASENAGFRIKLYLPSEIEGVVPQAQDHHAVLDFELLDFFSNKDLRLTILEREGNRCFYCMTRISEASYVVEHVVSRPTGDGSYRNVVAACRTCNNRKKSSSASDFLRQLYRESILSQEELTDRMLKLDRLTSGDLRPNIEFLKNTTEVGRTVAKSDTGKVMEAAHMVDREPPGKPRLA